MKITAWLRREDPCAQAAQAGSGRLEERRAQATIRLPSGYRQAS